MDEPTYLETHQKISRFNTESHEALTAWIQTMQRATIVQLNSGDEWRDDEMLIQVRRMGEEDLEKQVDLEIPEHEYESTLDVIKLPMEIPIEQESPAPQFLFIRPDDYELFSCLQLRRRCILTGNTGISKSWFQWKFILFCYRPELYNQFRPSKVIRQDQMEEEQKQEPALKKHKLQERPSWIPHLIVQTIGGRESYLFFVNRKHDVLSVKHDAEDLKRFTNENTTILWEPGEGTQPICYYGIQARIIATVSPDIRRFHEFKKYAGMVFMPCPSELQLRLMGQIYRKFAKEPHYRSSDKEIYDRVKKYGPFIRVVLCWTEDERADFEVSRLHEVRHLCADKVVLQRQLESPQHIFQKETGSSVGLSYRLACFIVDRDHTGCYGFRSIRYRSSCEEVLNLISQRIWELTIEDVKKHLKCVNAGDTGLDDFVPVYLERIIVHHAISSEGLTWKHRVLKQQSQMSAEDVGTADWQLVKIQLDRVERGITTYEDMKAGVLYYPSDRSFPLVDMYWKNAAGDLLSIQSSRSKVHAKPVSVYRAFLTKLGISLGKIKLHLYYLILPVRVEHFNHVAYPESQFWQGVRGGIPKDLKDNIRFHALLPPESFEATSADHGTVNTLNKA